MISILRILAWASASAIAICVGFALLAVGWFALGAGHSQGGLDRFRGSVWWSLYAAVVVQALLPHLLLSLLAWLVVTRRYPRLERSWLSLLAGTTLTAAGCFPLVGWLTFAAWNPNSVRDYLATLLLVTGGTSAALVLPPEGRAAVRVVSERSRRR